MEMKAILAEQQPNKEVLEEIKTGVETLLETKEIKAGVDQLQEDSQTIQTNLISLKQDTNNIIMKLNDANSKKRYGFKIKKSEADCDSRVEYIYDAVGMIPAKMNYETGIFDYGSWKDIWFVKENYPCMVGTNGIEHYKLNPNDYSKKLHDNTDSDYANVNYDGNAMSALPLCWIKRYEEGDYEYVIFCQTQYDNSYKAYAHTRADGSIANVIYHAMFKGSIVDGKMRSLANQPPQNFTNAQQEIDAAQKNGSQWSIRSWSIQNLIADMCTLISKTEQSQRAFGQGQTTGHINDANVNYGLHVTGSLYNKGAFWGAGAGITTEQMKVFHIEDFWGNRWDRILGLMQTHGVYKAKMTPEGVGYNLTGNGYAVLPVLSPPSGWQKNTYMSEFGRVPISNDGQDEKWVSDHYWVNLAGDIQYIGLSGGTCDDGSRCGARSLDLNNDAAFAWWTIGGSLTLIPNK